MKKSLFILHLILITYLSQAQIWSWAKSGDGAGAAGEGISINTDLSGNVFATGAFQSPTITFGTYTLTNTGSTDVFLVKYDSNGNVLWAKSAVGNYIDYPWSVCTDPSGNVIITGGYSSPTITFGTYTLTNLSAGAYNIFIVKYDTNGNVLWAKSEGSTSEAATSVCTNTTGEIFVTGWFGSPTVTFGTYTLTNSGYSSIFLTKYDTNGNVLWAKSAVGSSFDNPNSVSTDPNGNSFITGYFDSPTISFGSYTLTNYGLNKNVFLAKYDPNGNVLWAKSAGGSTGDDAANFVCNDNGGNVYITGSYASNTANFGTYTLSNIGGSDAFLAKYDNNGNIIWVKKSSGSGVNDIIGWSVSANNNAIFTSGGFKDTSITIGGTTHTVSSGYPDPMYISMYDFNGGLLCNFIYSSGGDDWIGIKASSSPADVFVTGDFISNPFVLGTNTLTLTGVENVFTGKLTFDCLALDVKPFTSDNSKTIIYPNPSNGSFIVEIESEIKNGELILMNSIGQKIYEQKVNTGLNDIKIIGLCNGLYNYVVLQAGQKIKSGKLAIQ